jgi:hypothetical protein
MREVAGNSSPPICSAYDNERIEIADLRGSIAPDLHGSFAEWKAHATAKCNIYLYSLWA